MKLENKIESVLFFKNEPVTVKELAKILNEDASAVKDALKSLQEFYKERGVVIVSDGDEYSLGTHPSQSDLVEKLQKEEFSRDLGRAGLETLAIILYKGPISRREIDHIRGVNSGFILRTLLVRGLIERTEGESRSYTYKGTLKLLQYLGLSKKEDLPEYETAFKKIEIFMKTSPEETDNG